MFLVFVQTKKEKKEKKENDWPRESKQGTPLCLCVHADPSRQRQQRAACTCMQRARPLAGTSPSCACWGTHVHGAVLTGRRRHPTDSQGLQCVFSWSS